MLSRNSIDKELNIMDVKKNNEIRILKLLYWNQGLTQQEIKDSLHLSAPTVIQIIQQFKELTLIKDGDELGSSGGRKPRTLEFDYNSRYLIGIEIRKKSIKYILINLKGSIIKADIYYKSFENTEQYWVDINGFINEKFLKSNEINMIYKIGIAFPGEISLQGNSIVRSTVLGVADISLVNIKKHFTYPVIFEYGANAAGFGAVWRSPSNKLQDAIYIVVTNNGIAGTIIQNNTIYQGMNRRAGAFGHMTLDPNGKVCFCGSRGCWTTFCALSVLSEHTDDNLEHFFTRLRENDLKCREIWEEYVKYFAQAIVNIRLSFDTDIIIGGNGAKFLRVQKKEIINKINEHAIVKDAEQFLKFDDISDNAQALGVALMNVETLLSGDY